MTPNESSDVADILQRVQSWPAPRRIILARRILETLEGPTAPEPSPTRPRGLSAAQVMAQFKPALPSPSDEECERVLEEELSKKYGV